MVKQSIATPTGSNLFYRSIIIAEGDLRRKKPCIHCLKVLVNTGLKEIYYEKPYKLHTLTTGRGSYLPDQILWHLYGSSFQPATTRFVERTTSPWFDRAR